MKYCKKPVVVEATQWFNFGDHPVVKRTCSNCIDACKQCGEIKMYHGKVRTLEGEMMVCPGDWIITGVKGEHYPCKPDIFEMTYEAVTE